MHLDTVLGGAACARGRGALPHLPEQLRRGTAAPGPVSLGAQYPHPQCTRMAGVSPSRLHRSAHPGVVSFSFLLVCLLNAMGLMLAKIMGRAVDIGVRRALGASRRAIFSQCLIEAGVVGFAGGLLGLGLTLLGLSGLRSLLSDDVNRLTHFSAIDVAIAITVSVVATTLAGLYPTWRAVQVQPAWQLKAQ